MRWWALGLGLILGGCTAQPDLNNRLAQYPKITAQPGYNLETADVYYPQWFVGKWQVTATLEAVEAPLGTEFTNPAAFARSQREIGKPVVYTLRFYQNDQEQVIADRTFNTVSITQAYLGKGIIREVIAPNTNRQTILMTGNRRGELFITRRHSEHPTPEQFGALEFYRQVLTTLAQVPVTRDIEATTLYQKEGPRITATQMTAVFLVPTDQRYFQSKGQAVTAYRYRLVLDPA